MSGLPVFVATFAENCPACIKFKQYMWNDLRSVISNFKKVQLVEVTVPAIGDSLPNEYPKDLNRFVKFYPIFMLIPASTWANGLAGHSMKNVLIYGATVDPSGKVIMLPTMSPSKDSIFEWVKNNIENDAIFKAGFVENPEVKGNGSTSNGNVPNGYKRECKMIPTEGSLCTFKKVSKR